MPTRDTRTPYDAGPRRPQLRAGGALRKCTVKVSLSSLGVIQ